MHKDDRQLVMKINTGGLTMEEEDHLVNALLRVAKKHSVAVCHVEVPMHMDS